MTTKPQHDQWDDIVELARLRDAAAKVPLLEADNAVLMQAIQDSLEVPIDVAIRLGLRERFATEPHPGAALLERLHTAESERDALKRDMNAEMDGKLALRSELGAKDNETYPGFVRRIASERDVARQDVDRLALAHRAEMREMMEKVGESTRLAEAMMAERNDCAGEVATLRERVATLKSEQAHWETVAHGFGWALVAAGVARADTAEARVATMEAERVTAGETESDLRRTIEQMHCTLEGVQEGATEREREIATARATAEACVREMRAALADVERDLRVADQRGHWGIVRDAQKVLEGILLQGPLPSQPPPAPAQGDVWAELLAVVDAMPAPLGHSHDWETDQHEEDCDHCHWDVLQAKAKAARLSTPTPPALVEAVGEALTAWDEVDTTGEFSVEWDRWEDSLAKVRAAYDAVKGGGR